MREKKYTEQLVGAVTEDTYRDVRQLTDEQGGSISSWVREAIETKLEQENKFRKE